MGNRRTFGLFLAVAGLATTAFAADQPAPIVTVGSATMSTGDLTRRLAAVPSYQLKRYGATPEEIKKRYVDEVIVPEMLYGEDGLKRKLDQTPELRSRVDETLRDALDRAVREEALAKEPVTDDEIKKYYEDNKARYETPKRIKVWRIQVPDEAAAKAIIELAEGADGPRRWAEAAREKSSDKATAQRSGDLGFVRPDGSTDVPRVKVDAAVYAAVEKVKDGALVTAPLKEGDVWSVLWRRGSIDATKRTLEDEATSIRQLLERRRADRARQDLVAKLKREQVKESHPDLLSHIDIEAYGSPRRNFKRDKGLRLQRDAGLRIPKASGSVSR